MNTADTICKYFDLMFDEYERNRMYPLGTRKESAMKKMTLEHISAIANAELFLQPAITRNPEPKFRQAIEKDLERLAEIKRFILQTIYEPKFEDLKDVPEDPG